mgnify:CR=1 FL=1
MSRRDWTAKERLLVIQWSQEGISQREAAQRLNRTIPAIKDFCNRNDIRFRNKKYPPDTDKKIRNLIARNIPPTEISRKLGMPYPTLEHRLRKLGLKVTPEGHKKAKRKAYYRFLEDRGFSPGQVHILSRRIAEVRAEHANKRLTEKHRGPYRKRSQNGSC